MVTRRWVDVVATALKVTVAMSVMGLDATIVTA
jgi:hypothetical protein